MRVPQSLHDDKGRDESVGDNDLNLVFRVESKHGLLSIMARGFKNVVPRLSDEQRSDAEVDSALVVVVKDCVAVQEHRRADQVQELVDQVRVRSFVVDVLLPHNALIESVIRVDHRLRRLLLLFYNWSWSLSCHCICVHGFMSLCVVLYRCNCALV